MTTASPDDDVRVRCLSWINERLRRRVEHEVERRELSALRRSAQTRMWTYFIACSAGIALVVLRLLKL